MKTKILFFSLFFFVSANYGVNAQAEHGLPRSAHSGFYTVDAEQARQVAVKSEKDMTLFYTFASWCGPCRKQLPEVVNFAKQHDIDLYLLLVDKEDDSFFLRQTESMIDTVYHNTLKALIITDSLYTQKSFKKLNAPVRKYIQIYGKRHREKYTRFLEQITPDSLEVSNGMGKKILINRSGRVMLVTGYEDKEGLDDHSKQLEKIAASIKQERTGKK